ncbi:1,4-dihydroxy-2-naphthoate octaprenyltransferase [Spirochaetota bacterium]
MNILMHIQVWIKAMRAPFFQAVIIPVLVGTAIAYFHTGQFHAGYFILTLIGAICINGGTNLTNDYFDHKTSADDINKNYTPFSGGSRAIQDGILSPRKIITAAMIFFGIAVLIGAFLVYKRGWILLLIGSIGVLSGYFYTASPFRFGYRGWGEVIAGLDCGPLPVLGAYYVQAQAFSIEALYVSIPIGIFITAVLWINQFPDYSYDKKAKKNTLIVKLGPDKAIKGYLPLMISPYIIIAIGTLLGVIHWVSLFALLSLPLALKAVMTAKVHYKGNKKLIPAMAGTIMTHLATGLLLFFAYLIKSKVSA